MKLYYVEVMNDAAGEAAIKEHDEKVMAAGGGITLSRSHGVGTAILVMTLPDQVLPEEVGFPTAEFQMNLTIDHPEEEKEDSEFVQPVWPQD